MEAQRRREAANQPVLRHDPGEHRAQVELRDARPLSEIGRGQAALFHQPSEEHVEARKSRAAETCFWGGARLGPEPRRRNVRTVVHKRKLRAAGYSLKTLS